MTLEGRKVITMYAIPEHESLLETANVVIFKYFIFLCLEAGREIGRKAEHRHRG